MLIKDLPALRNWLVTTLEPLCGAEPIGLANDILRLFTRGGSFKILRRSCIRRLKNILNESTVNFVDQLFDNIENGQYISEKEKENIPPKPIKNTTKIFEQQENNREIQSISKSTTSPFTTINRSIKRTYSSMSENSSSTKRIQYSYSHLSTDPVSLSNTHIIRKCTTCFEDLPNEILYDMFEYIDIYDVYQIFFNVNLRFQRLLIDSSVPIQIVITNLSIPNVELYYKNFLLPNKHRINRIHVSNPFIVHTFFLPSYGISKFSKIEILRVYDIKSIYIKNILDFLMDLPELYSLTINVIDNIDDVNIFYIKIFGLSKLTFCQVEYKSIPNKTNTNYLVIDATIFSPLQQLIINADFPTNSLDILFSYLPQIRRLSIDRLTPSTTKEIKPIIMPHLKHVTLKLNNIKFNEFEQIMKNFFENIQILSINTNNDQDYIQATKWEQLIINHIPDLSIFSLYYDGIDSTTSIHNHFQLNELVENFNSTFWIERKWFFNYQYVNEESSDGGIVYTIDPYR
ncbi:unnamed protein product [Rotaria sp. Silwood2]|nr:unnamed protein product [Rotaria sp. Silwood2]